MAELLPGFQAGPMEGTGGGGPYTPLTASKYSPPTKCRSLWTPLTLPDSNSWHLVTWLWALGWAGSLRVAWGVGRRLL